MTNLFSWFLRGIYAYTCLLGLKNFEMDLSTGHTWTTWRNTIYTAMMNILLFSLMPIQIILFDSTTLRGKVLYQYVFMLMSLIRIIGVYGILISGWIWRCQIRALVYEVIQLVVTKPQLRKDIRNLVLWKMICAFFTEILHFYIAYLLHVKIGALYGLILLGISTSIFNLLTAQLCFIILIIRARYQILNADLRAIIEEIHLPHQPLYNYYKLVDRINDIAQTTQHLQTLMQKIMNIFGFQSFCVVSVYFLSTIASIHFTYTIFKYSLEIMSLSVFDVIMTCLWAILYHSDGCLNVFTLFHLLDTRPEMISIMANRTLFPIEMDKRIDAAFENLQLQLTCQPLKFSLLNLFYLDRSSAVVVGNALIINAILLIQYDIGNYKV